MTVPTANKPRPQYRIPHFPLAGSPNIDAIWDQDADKYKTLFRSVHVTKASMYIGVTQLAIIVMFLGVVLYGIAFHSGSLHETWSTGMSSDRLAGQLLAAISLQLTLVLTMMYGIKAERRGFLLPFIVFSIFAIFLAFLQMTSDLIRTTQQRADSASLVQILSHLVGMFVHMWCVAVIWRCYCYLGDKKVAQQIKDNLQTTAPFVCEYTQPPPYENTVIEKKNQLSAA
ncbi:hypothetical protein WR25_21225 [Diploscapter pachys]|uniref:Uncharacterized protein n=1 Tax=Diploscapter pachys TaxID=2018661 RepID=A0A2A2LSW6_9BILA|nr:hypothetical protein WR25_21225 [Diploscapter pachys]